jgi:plastocyanin
MKPLALILSAVALSAMAACGGDAASGDTHAADTHQQGAGAVPGAPQEPDAGRRVIEVDMVMDDEGNNVFIPADFEASPGDVIRYKLVSGVHNVHFLADSNPGARGLPPMGEMLQLPGQTWDYKVAAAPGRYFYQCDPHALIGMVGYLTVR